MSCPNVILSLIGDYAGARPEGVPLVETDSDYVVVCSQIRTEAPAEIWIRSPVHQAWLTVFADTIGFEAIRKEKTPRVLLAEKMGCTIPEWLTDQQILAEGLLSGTGKPGKAGRFVSARLSEELSPVFEEPELVPEILPGVLAAVLDPASKERFEAKPSLMRCLEEQCDFWAATNATPWVGYACERLPRASAELHRDLTFHALLSRYPGSLQEYKLTAQTRVALKDLDPKALLAGPKHTVALSETEDLLKTEVTAVLREIKTKSDFQKLLKCFTGQVRAEFDLALAVLDDEHITLDPDLLEEIRICFEEGGAVPRAKLDALSLRIPPPLPEIRSKGFASWKEWEQWCLREYFPYRAWQQDSGTFHPDVEKMVENFSAWVVEHYPSLHADVDISLIHVLKGLENSFRDENLSILLVVDCLSEFFRPDLQARFSEQGLYTHTLRHVCAPLPSCTEVSKPLLLSGSHEGKGSDYETLLKRCALERWPEKRIRYFGGNLGALKAWDGCDGCNVLVLNDLFLDELMHSDAEALATSYKEEANRHFVRMANAVREMMDNWQGDPTKVGIHVVTDHGATRILEAESESVDSSMAAKLFPNEKYRFAKLTQEEAALVPQSLWSLGHSFKSPFVEQDAQWFIPRGHHTVRSAKHRGFVHGGATPEELLVPVMTFRPVSVTWKPPECRADGLRLNPEGEAIFYVRRLQSMRLELRNPNLAEMEISGVDAVSAGAEIRQCDLVNIPPQGKADVPVEIMFNDAAVSESDLVLKLIWNIQGQQEISEMRIPARIQSAMGGGFSLKDL